MVSYIRWKESSSANLFLTRFLGNSGSTAMIGPNSEQRHNGGGSPSDTNGNGNNDNLSRIIEGDPEYAKDFNNAY